MKKNLLSVLAGALVLPVVANAQYAIDWLTLDGGGGTSSGGSFTLTGTIGQPDAGTLAGGNYTLDGGFWGGVFAVQQVGAPTLHIVQAGANVMISWTPATPGFVLQISTNLSIPSVLNWPDAPSGATNPIT